MDGISALRIESNSELSCSEIQLQSLNLLSYNTSYSQQCQLVYVPWPKRVAASRFTCVLLYGSNSSSLPFQEHIYKLMKSDSYPRFIRSSAYQELLQAKKKVLVHLAFVLPLCKAVVMFATILSLLSPVPVQLDIWQVTSLAFLEGHIHTGIQYTYMCIYPACGHVSIS